MLIDAMNDCHSWSVENSKIAPPGLPNWGQNNCSGEPDLFIGISIFSWSSISSYTLSYRKRGCILGIDKLVGAPHNQELYGLSEPWPSSVDGALRPGAAV